MPAPVNITLDQVLALVGKLDDTPGAETPRERFRQFLEQNVLEVGVVRDYIEACLRVSGDQYSRALQDLVNYLGTFLGFHVTYGRYQGVQGQIGFDGHWASSTGFHVVVEVKTSDVYAIKTSPLVGYIDKLIDEKKIPNWEVALGLYVVGRPDAGSKQLENAIIVEKRTHQLRVISVGSVLALAEMMTQYGLAHDDMLAVLRPSGPAIDPLVELMVRLVSEPSTVVPPPAMLPQPTLTIAEPQSAYPPSTQEHGALVPSLKSPSPHPGGSSGSPGYWLTPVRDTPGETAEECVSNLVGQAGIYAFGDHTPGRKQLKVGDLICFYASGRGIVGYAQVMSLPERKPHPKVRDSENYPWVFKVGKANLHIDKPHVIDLAVRSQLDVFHDKDANGPWAWFVKRTPLSRHKRPDLKGRFAPFCL